MRFKLDENLRNAGADLIRAAGHDVDTVVDEGLQSAPDVRVLDAAVADNRCLVTLDTDFANPFVHPPLGKSGIVVIRVRGKGRKRLIEACVRLLLKAVAAGDVTGRLWIVEPERIREYQASFEEE